MSLHQDRRQVARDDVAELPTAVIARRDALAPAAATRCLRPHHGFRVRRGPRRRRHERENHAAIG